jgi:hypothetical protein
MSVTIGSKLTAAPERMTVRTCFGCGAMGALGECDTGCREQQLELVRAAAFDDVAAVRASAHACVDAFLAVVETLAWRQPPAADYESAYRSLQERARAVLRRYPRPPVEDVVLDGATVSATATWCEDCGAIESFQPCMEVCIWRPVEWVSASSYSDLRERALAQVAIESRLRGLLSRVAWVTPLDGEWRTCWRVLAAEARRALAAIDVPDADRACVSLA